MNRKARKYLDFMQHQKLIMKLQHDSSCRMMSYILANVYQMAAKYSFCCLINGHKSLEYCCLVIHLTSVSIIYYAESNSGIFGHIGHIKPETSKAQQKVNRSPRLKLRRKRSSKKGVRKT